MTRSIGRLALLITSALVLDGAPAQAQIKAAPQPMHAVPNAGLRKVLPSAGMPNTSGVQSLTLNPDAVYAGQSTSITLELVSAAPAGGAEVLLGATPAGMATLPSSITVPAGQTTGSFLVATASGAGNATLQISASEKGAGGKLSAPLKVVAAVADADVQSVSVPGTVPSWAPATGTVTLASAAQGNGATVVLSSSDASLLKVPASVVVPAGQTSQTFALTGASFGAAGAVTVNASSNGATKSAGTRVLAGTDIVGFSGFPTYLKAGTPVTGTVKIAGVAPAGGVTIPVYAHYYHGNPTIPSTVAIAAGQSSGPLTISGPGGVTLDLYTNASDLKANVANCWQQPAPCIPMEIELPPTLADLRFRICTQNTSTCYALTTTLEPAQTGTLDVIISNPWPDQTVVTLTSSNPQAASVPANLTFSGSNFELYATVTAHAVSDPTTVTLTASCASCPGGSKAVVVQIVPGVAVSAITVAQSAVKGGTGTTGTVTLSKAAGTGGTKVDLTSTNPTICTVPPTVTVPAGQSTASFAVSTQAVLSTATVTLGGSVAGGTPRTTTVQVKP
jgi:hypothetical protein